MKNFMKVISFVIAFCMLMSIVSCGSDDENNDNKKTSQKVYNTAFQQATTAVPNSTTEVTETETETATGSFTLPSTEKRTGKRGSFKQTTDMRNITSKQLLSEMGAGITLGDSFLANGVGAGKTVEEYETYLENPIVSEALINAYAKAEFSAIRVPVSWTDHMDENGAVDEEWLNRIQEVVDLVLDNGMYCIINSQNDQSWLTTDAKTFSDVKLKFNAMWTSIATRFSTYNDHLLFEGVSGILKADNDKSEPSETDLKNANAINQEFVNTVRKTGGNNKKRHLIVSTYGAFVSSTALDGFELPKDTVKNRLIAKVDVYVPSSFCLDESTKHIWGSVEDKAYLENVLGMVNYKITDLKIPVIVGEFGVVDKGNISARTAYAKHFVSTAYNYYMVCFWNDNGGNMRLFDRKTASVYAQNILGAIIDSAG